MVLYPSMKELLKMLSPAITVFPEDSPMRTEALRVVGGIVKLSLVSNKSLYAHITAIETLQELQEILDEVIDVIDDESFPSGTGSAEGSEADKLIQLIEDAQDPEDN